MYSTKCLTDLISSFLARITCQNNQLTLPMHSILFGIVITAKLNYLRTLILKPGRYKKSGRP